MLVVSLATTLPDVIKTANQNDGALVTVEVENDTMVDVVGNVMQKM
jgi:hypothetical protein